MSKVDKISYGPEVFVVLDKLPKGKFMNTKALKVTTASDLVFKTIMLGKNGKVILERILKTIFRKSIKIKRYLNVELLKLALNEKSKRLDLLIETNIDYINIEANNNDYFKEKITRNFKYLCEFLVQNVKKGKSYKLNKSYIQLNLN